MIRGIKFVRHPCSQSGCFIKILHRSPRLQSHHRSAFHRHPALDRTLDPRRRIRPRALHSRGPRRPHRSISIHRLLVRRPLRHRQNPQIQRRPIHHRAQKRRMGLQQRLQRPRRQPICPLQQITKPRKRRPAKAPRTGQFVSCTNSRNGVFLQIRKIPENGSHWLPFLFCYPNLFSPVPRFASRTAQPTRKRSAGRFSAGAAGNPERSLPPRRRLERGRFRQNLFCSQTL